MSKKSRKRNKKILAAIGLGLGAAAMASKKRNASIADNEANESGFAASTKKPSIAAVSGTKKDTAKKSEYKDSIMSGGSGVKYSKSTPKKRVKLTLGVGDGGPLKLKDNSIRAKNRQTSSAGIKEPNKPMIASILPKSQTADNYAGDMRDFGKTNYKSGGRAGYKSGGSSVKKSMGKALRGGGKVIR